MQRGGSNTWVVIKFGGTSVSSLKCWKTILSITQDRLNEGLRPVIVCSAISGISDLLEKLVLEAKESSHKKTLEAIEKKHGELAKELDVDIKCLKENFNELTRLTDGIFLVREISPHVHAQILSLGEIMLTKLGFAYLQRNGISISWHDARKILATKELPGARSQRNILSASCDHVFDEKLNKLISDDSSSVILTQGFIAGDANGETVLLGRGGSDVSAAYFASKLGAKRCEIWTDVPGMYTANPRQVPSARLIKELDYEEAQEIASSGAKVLHPRCLPPLHAGNIPLHIYSLEHPKIKGTIITSDVQGNSAQVKAVSSKNGITLISMETIDMWHQIGFLAGIFNCFKQHGLSIDLVSTSESSVTVTLDTKTNTLDPRSFDSLIDELKTFCHVQVVDSCSTVSLVGRNIRSILHQLAPALELFEEQKIYLMSQAANDLNITFVVDDDQAPRLVQKIHGELFSKNDTHSNFGPTWEETSGKKKTPSERTAPAWWQKRKDDLLDLAKNKTPIYVYNEKTVLENIENLKTLSAVDQIFYSIKANSHPKILAKCHERGLGFECVSPGEVGHILKLFSDIDPKRILFTPNFASKEEYAFGFENNINVTLDNLFPLENWTELFKNKEIFIRIDPGHASGHHKYVHTAGSRSKFGVLPLELEKIIPLLKKNEIRVTGLHAHVGSNIFNTDVWSDTASFLSSLANELPDVKIIDAGGGLGVTEKPGQAPLELEGVNKKLLEVKKANPKYKLWIEPGRFVVANAGVLLAKVTQTKGKDGFFYVGVNAGMNSLIRPALYGSYHDIVNLSRLDETKHVIANIVGPICESGDFLGHSRRIAEPVSGDIILIDTVGAYGKVMSSNYNMREPADECFMGTSKNLQIARSS